MANAILVLILAATSFINFYQANNSINRGTFFMMRDHVAKADPSSDDAKDTKNVIDESFHKCSKEKSCCKVAENIKSNKNGIVAVGEELPLEKQDARIWHKDKIIKIEILSAGFDDPGIIKSMIRVDGIDYSKNERGYNVVVLSGTSGDVINADVIKVHESNGAVRMTEYINSIENGNIVLIAAHDEVGIGMTTQAEQAVHALEATTRLVLKNGRNDVRYRGSFALVAKKGGKKPSWFGEKAADRRIGPSQIEVQIPIC